MRGGSSYYAYPSIEHLAVNSHDARELKTIFRTVCDFAPTYIYMASGQADYESVAATLAFADSRTEIAAISDRCPSPPNRSLLYVSRLSENAFEFAEKVFDREGMLITRGLTMEESDKIKELLRAGMTFKAGNLIIMVSRADLPRQDFEINL